MGNTLNLAKGRGRSVSRKLVDKLQQRIETLEALNQRTADHSACGSNEDGSVPRIDAAPLPRSTKYVHGK